ncbi:MAG: hypothetical protein ABIS45_15460 [Burkholderiales bacterium]
MTFLKLHASTSDFKVATDQKNQSDALLQNQAPTLIGCIFLKSEGPAKQQCNFAGPERLKIIKNLFGHCNTIVEISACPRAITSPRPAIAGILAPRRPFNPRIFPQCSNPILT